LNSAGEGTGLPRVFGQECQDLPADLQSGDVGVAPDAVDAFDIEHDVAVEHVIDVDRRTHELLLEDSLGLTLRNVEATSGGGLVVWAVRGWPQ